MTVLGETAMTKKRLVIWTLASSLMLAEAGYVALWLTAPFDQVGVEPVSANPRLRGCFPGGVSNRNWLRYELHIIDE